MESDDERRPQRRGVGTWGVLTAGIGVLTLTMCVWYTLILVNPYSPVNPLPPATVTPYPGLQNATPGVNPDAATTAAGPAVEQPTAAPGDSSSPTPPVAAATAVQPGVATLTPNATAPAGAGTPTVAVPALRSPSPTGGAPAQNTDTPNTSGTAYPGAVDPYPKP